MKRKNLSSLSANGGGDGLTDEELKVLVLRLKEGDTSVCAAIYRETIGFGWDAASMLLQQREDIQDVLQISYAKAFQHIDQLKSPAFFRAWLRRIILNESKNYLKKQNVIDNTELLRLADLPMKDPQDPQANDFMNRAELRDLIETALASLSEDKRRCLELFYYDHLKISEIADLLAIPEGTVKTRLRAAKQELRKAMESSDDLGSMFSFSLLPLFFAEQAQTANVPPQILESIGAHIAETSGSAAAGATAAGSTATASAGTAASAAAAASSATASAAAGSVAAITGTVAFKAAAVAVAASVALGGGAAVKHLTGRNRSAIPKAVEAMAETAPSEESLASFLEDRSASSANVESATAAFSQITKAPGTSAKSQSAIVSSVRQPTSAAVQTQIPAATSAEKSTAVKETTARETTAKTKKTTTQKATSTQKATTTAKQTTAAEETTARNTDADYRLSGGTLTGYDGADSSVSIPASVQCSAVTAIGASAFSGNTTMRSVSIPSGVTQIGQEAFSDCTNLSSVSMPSSLDRIGIGAFYGCNSLKSVAIPAGTSAIADEAFADCTSLKTVTIPASVTSIADDAFDGCNDLTIQCKSGSAAEAYAIENDIPYHLI